MTDEPNTPIRPARAVEVLLGRTFPGHTMQRVRTAEGKYRYGYVGSGVQELFGLDPEDLMSRPEVDHAWVHPEDRPRFLEALESSAANLTPLDEEVRVERPGGGYRWVRSIGHPRRQPDGTIIWDGVALDIHDRHEALETLAAVLSQVRDSETREDRFSAIAAQDLHERLEALRRALDAFAPGVRPDQEEHFDDLRRAFSALSQAVLAANDLAVTVEAPARPGGGEGGDVAGLTARQADILRRAARGLSNRDIGAELGLSEGTVKQHMTRILRRLGAQNRTEAVAHLHPGGRTTA